MAAPPATVSLFDGTTLNGWVLLENTVYRVSRYDISDTAIFIGKIAKSADPVSGFVRSAMTEPLQNDLSTYSTGTPQANVTLPALVNELNQLLTGPSIYDAARFQDVAFRPETKRLLAQKLHGMPLAHLNKLLLEDAYPTDLVRNSAAGWIVKDGAVASTGAGRGVIYTAKDYTRYRLTLTMRHVSGNPDHQACFLIFCARPQPGEIPLDVLGGIQFQPPNGGHWDYRPAVNGSGGAEFTTVNKTRFDPHQWSRVEMLVDAGKGTARHGWRSLSRSVASRWRWFASTILPPAGPDRSHSKCTTRDCLMSIKTSPLKWIRRTKIFSPRDRLRLVDRDTQMIADYRKINFFGAGLTPSK